MQILSQQHARALEFGIYRDGDNNLDASQAATLGQALQTSAHDRSVQFTVEDTTGLRVADGALFRGKPRTDGFTIADGRIADPQIDRAHNMASEANLARFVARTLDNAEASGAKQTWIDLVDHGGGDGGGLETHTGAVMKMPNMAKAIADGVALHAREHPEDAGRGVDGVVANQCLMDTMGFADALSRVGVKYLAASPETMLSPGVPSSVAHDIAANLDDPTAMAQAVTNNVMHTRYGGPHGFGPAAAFDVLDLSPDKIAKAEGAIKRLNDDASSAAQDPAMRAALRRDVGSVRGMVRFHGAPPDMPWHADRPAIAMYRGIARDTHVTPSLRGDASAAAKAVGDLILAHRESARFGPFDGSSYRDAVGPTVHAPLSRGERDPWAPKVSETHNAFYTSTDQARFADALA